MFEVYRKEDLNCEFPIVVYHVKDYRGNPSFLVWEDGEGYVYRPAFNYWKGK